MGEARTVTVLLRAWRDGDRTALDELVPKIYAELRRLAESSLRRERPGHTMRPTDLVSEAYLRLSQGEASQPEWNDRLHFFAIAARNMRQILVDHARRRGAGKRGGGERPVELEEVAVDMTRPVLLLDLDDALRRLAEQDERKARAIELLYFGGLTQQEVADVLEISLNTVARDVRFAEAWLRRELSQR